jgi:dipeptidyl aminopeptidase/acylaminoacyl peptidase
MFKKKRYLAAICLLVFTCTAAADDRPKPRARVERFLLQCAGVKASREVAISPNGRSVAWVGQEGLYKDGHPLTEIYIKDLTRSAQPRTVIGERNFQAHLATKVHLMWSPDSRRLLYLSDSANTGQYQIGVTGGEEPGFGVPHLNGLIASPRWSPDGKQVAFLQTENASRNSGPLQPGAVETGVIGEHVDEQQLAVVDLATQRVRKLSPADMYVYEYDWSSDGRRLAAIAAHGSGDNNWYIAELVTIDVATGEMRSILKPPMQMAVPRWSPDGQTIAFIGGLMSDEGVVGGDIFTIPASGGEARNRTPNLKASASSLSWIPDNKRIIFTEHVAGGSGISTVDVSSGKVESLWRSAESIWADSGAVGVSLAADGKTSALVRSSFDAPPEVWAGPIGQWKQITHSNQGLERLWGQIKSVHWKSDDLTVQGWLMFPRDYAPNQRYPMIVHVHGGPASALQPRWTGSFFDGSLLSNAGYFVLFPNPRGSYGQGEHFTQANVKDFGYGDFRDIMAGVDEVLKNYPVDPKRLGITGWSYGGYMTMWAVTQTDRFRAAVAGAGLANWQSYYGQNGIDQWMIPYFGASVYDDPAVYAKSSPINFIKRVKTPTLVVVGERDVECPTPQSYEFWHALKTLGVPTQLVVYPGEGHAISNREHQKDILQRSLDWFEKYLR